MNRWTQVWLLAKREFLEWGRSKPFLVTMAILVVVIFAIGPATNALSGGPPEATTIGLAGDVLDGIEDELVAQGDLFGIEIEVVAYRATADYVTALEAGAVEEKQNRVVEVVLSRVRPWQVLVGKVAGIGILALVQLSVLLSAGYISAQLAGFADFDVAAIGLPIIAGVFFWFLLGYTFYAFLHAAVGSTVSRQEDLQGAIVLPVILILPGYLLAIAAAENPDGTLVWIGSILPMWAPFVMPVRIAAGSAAPWEVAVAVIGLVVAALALVWFGSRVYAGALLRTGGRMRLRDARKAASE